MQNAAKAPTPISNAGFSYHSDAPDGESKIRLDLNAMTLIVQTSKYYICVHYDSDTIR